MTTKTSSLVQDESSVDTAVVYNELEVPDLTGMKHVVFLDLDNFFDMMPYNLPYKTFTWIFRGGRNLLKPPKSKMFVLLLLL